MTICKFNSCACVVEWEEPLTDFNRQARFIQQCRTHNTPKESLEHNGLIKEEDVRTESQKPQFQRS